MQKKGKLQMESKTITEIGKRQKKNSYEMRQTKKNAYASSENEI